MSFLEPWEKVERSEQFEAELVREMAASYPLWGKKIKAIAKRRDCDDVLFKVDKGERTSFVVVHLTWSRQVEPVGYPRCEFFESFQEFETNRMVHDNQMY